MVIFDLTAPRRALGTSALTPCSNKGFAIRFPNGRAILSTAQQERLLEENGITGAWPWTTDLLRTLLSVRAPVPRKPGVLIDVGAHHGDFAAAADRVLGFERIICVEPDCDLIADLKNNVPAEKSTVHAVALAHAPGEATLFIHGDRSMNSIVEADTQVLRDKFPRDRHDAISRRAVRTTTLDVLVAESGDVAGRSLFLKLDTQGNELEILRAGEKTLSQTVACLVEFMFCTPYATDTSFLDFVSFFDAHGLQCRGPLNVIRRPSHEISGVDFLFVRADSPPST